MEGTQYSGEGLTAIGGSVLMLFWLGLYIYFALTQFKIAQKLNHENAWFAWVPVLNLVQWIQLASKPLWWLVLMFVPIVNVVCAFIIYIEIAKATGHSPVVGFLTMIPPITLVTLGMMAFGNARPKSTPSQPSTPSRPPVPHDPAGVA